MDLKLSRNTIALGLTSFLVDISSEMLTPIMPLFLINVLKANALVVGLMEGISELIVAMMRAVSGFASDRLGERKRLIVFGYFIASVMKVFFVIAGAWEQVLATRALERVGKGIRGVPRDALITFSEKQANLGRAFGFRKMMDSLGAVAGPLIAGLLVAWLLPQLGEEMAYRTIFLAAVIPAIAGVIIAVKFVDDIKTRGNYDGSGIIHAVWGHRGYRQALSVGALFAIAQFGNAFFILKAQEITGSVLITVFGYAVFNISYALFAFPAGTLTDKFGGKRVTALAYLLFAFTVTGFAFAQDLVFLFFFAVFGLVMAILETAPRTFIAKIMRKGNYATAVGIYQGTTGALLLPANLIAGALWGVSFYGYTGTFIFSFIMSISAAVLMLTMVRHVED